MKILGIETSCDETASSVVEFNKNQIKILSNIISSSMDFHAKTGGIIPEVAAREQLKYIIQVVNEALTKSNCQPENIDAIAVTVGPGLIGSLLVGVETAKTLSYVWNKPVIPVNHLFGHIYANFIGKEQKDILFPSLALIISGGHTDLVLMQKKGDLQWISGTRDDAAGEAFDKIGRLLGLPYPAGPIIEKLAAKGDPKKFKLPRPLIHEDTLDFSFSGLKTAVLRIIQRIEKNDKTLDERTICDLARATQDAIIDVLINKTFKAIKQYPVQSLIFGGGVSANETLKASFQNELLSKSPAINFFTPEKVLCTDNAAMICAAAAIYNNPTSWENIEANPELYFD